MVVGVGADAIREQIAVGGPCVGYAVDFDQAIGYVVYVTVRRFVRFLRQAIPDRVVGVVEVFTGGVVRRRQAVERVEGVVDRHGLRRGLTAAGQLNRGLEAAWNSTVIRLAGPEMQAIVVGAETVGALR